MKEQKYQINFLNSCKFSIRSAVAKPGNIRYSPRLQYLFSLRQPGSQICSDIILEVIQQPKSFTPKNVTFKTVSRRVIILPFISSPHVQPMYLSFSIPECLFL